MMGGLLNLHDWSFRVDNVDFANGHWHAVRLKVSPRLLGEWDLEVLSGARHQFMVAFPYI